MKCRHFLFLTLIAAGMVSCDSSEEMYGPAETVTTHFTLSLDNKQVKTRQSADVVQADGTAFRGMRDIVMIPFSTSSITSSSSRHGNNIELPVAGAVPEIDNPNTIKGLNTNSNSQLYREVAIESGTRSFLFYGEAAPASPSTPKAQTGVLLPAGFDKDTPSGIQFNLESIAPEVDKTKAGYLMDYLTAIANTAGWAETAPTDPMYVLRQDLIGMTAGSSASVLSMVQDLYSTLLGNASALAAAIKSKIVSHEYQTGENCVESQTADGVLTFDAALSGWPSAQGLPDGAALIGWDGTQNKFIEKDGDNAGLLTAASGYAHYAYPASLYYMANSDIKVHNQSLADKYNDVMTWSDLLNKYTSGDAVTMTTRSIALKEPVQYAVARMDAKAWIESSSPLLDSKGRDVPFTDESFPITGILVGGQRTVDYQFQTLSAGHSEYTIYDTDVPDSWYLNTSSSSAVNHTLVLPSHEQGADGKVRVALEVQNNCCDFSGTGGKLISLGSKFYLVAELDATGQSAVNQRVFLKDYVTTVCFKVSSLASAYNVIPDLRLPELELGLGVDLDWDEHLSLGVVIE